MIFIPIGTDQPRSRFPRVTIGIIILCALSYPAILWLTAFFGVFNYATYQQYREMEQRLMIHWLDRQQGENGRDMEERYEKALRNYAAYNALLSDFKRAVARGEVIPLGSEEYRTWLRLSADFEAARKREPFYRFGYVPADFRPWAFFTHIFVHGSLGHLFWNMYFLWLIGIGIEDIWGRKWYLGIYLAGGVFAALFHHLITKAPDIPCIGASGAIAAILGAYMIRFYKARLRYGFFAWEFWVPAWVPLLFWFARDAWATIKGLETGVAVGAHVGGYLFGMAAALVLVKMKAEEGFIAEAVQKQDRADARKAEAKREKQGPLRLPEYDRGIKARQLGSLDEAADLFRDVLARQPDNLDALDELVRIRTEQKRAAELAPDLASMIARLLKKGQVEDAISHYNLLMQYAPAARVAGPWTYRLAQELHKREAYEHAVWEFLRFATVLPDDPLAPKAVFCAAGIEGGKRQNPARALEIITRLEQLYPAWMPDLIKEARERFQAQSENSPS
jgi:membrane associated rhomboid family serine protease